MREAARRPTRWSSRRACGPRGPTPGDQARVATPAAALAAGASHLVIGRPITAAAGPRRRPSTRILAEIEGSAPMMQHDRRPDARSADGRRRDSHGPFRADERTSHRHLRAVRADSRGPRAHHAARRDRRRRGFRRASTSISSPHRRSAGSSSGSPSRRRWGSSSSSASASRARWCSAGRSRCPPELACWWSKTWSPQVGALREVIDLVAAAGGEVVGVVSIIDRGGEKTFDAPFWPLLQLEVESWEPASCVLCADGRTRLLAREPPTFVVALGIVAGQG